MKQILVPLDGSALAERALPYAQQLARATSAQITLLRVAPSSTAAAEEYMAQIKERLDGELKIQTRIVSGVPALAIVPAARELAADLIVMTSHGRTALGRAVYGSVTDAVLRNASVPVLVAPSQVARPWFVAETGRPRKVLVALDSGDLAEQALPAALDLATSLQAEIVLAGVIVPPAIGYAEGYAYYAFEPEAQRHELEIYLEGVAMPLRTQGFSVSHFTAVGDAAAMLVEAARERGADAIVLATHGRSGMARLVLGSVALGVLRKSDLPVLLVRPQPTEPVQADAATGQSVVEPQSGPVTITLSAHEAELTRLALQELLFSSRREEHLAQPIHALLGRLGGGIAAGEPVSAGRAQEGSEEPHVLA